MGTRRGATVGYRPHKKKILAILGTFLLRFSHYGGLFSSWVGVFAPFFSMVEAFNWAYPAPVRKFLRAPMAVI